MNAASEPNQKVDYLATARYRLMATEQTTDVHVLTNPPLDTPDDLVDFLRGKAVTVVERANQGYSGTDEEYFAAVARVFDAMTARLLDNPDAGFRPTHEGDSRWW